MTPAAVLSILVKTQGVSAAAGELSAVDAAARKAAGGLDKASSGLSSAEQTSVRASKGYGAVSAAAKVGGLAVAGIGVAALNAAGTFEQGMNTLQSVSGATGGEMKALSKLAVKLGADTKLPGTSAQDAAEAMTEMVKSGVSLKDTMKGVRSVLVLSAAAGVSNKEAAEIASNALNVFKLRGQDVTMVADQLANTANASSVEIRDVADATKMAGAVFATFQSPVRGAKGAMTDLNTAIGLLGNAGIKGSDAGTSLKQALLMLAAPALKTKNMMRDLYLQTGGSAEAQRLFTLTLEGTTKAIRDKASNALEKLQGSTRGMGDIAYDASGKMRSLPDIVKQVTAATKNMTQEQRQSTIAQIFGADATRAILTLMRAGPKEWDKMSAAVQKQGAAQNLAAAKMKGFKGSLEAAKSAAETAAISLGTVLLPAATNVMKMFSGFAGVLGEHKTVTLVLIGVLGTLAVAVLAVNAAVSAWAAIQTVATIATKAWAAAQWLLNAAMDANPIGLIVLAIAALVAGLILAYQHSETFRDIVDGAFNAVKAVATPVVEWLATAIPAAWDAIKTATVAVWGFLAPYLKGVWDVIAAVVTTYFTVYKTVIVGVWTVVRDVTTTLWDWFGPYLTAVWDVVKAAVVAYFNAYKAIIGGVWTAIKAVTTALWDWFGSYLEAVWTAVKMVIVAQIGIIKLYIDAAWEAIKTTTSAAWTVIRALVVDPVRETVSAVKAALGSDGLRGWLNDTWDAIKGAASVAWNVVKTAVTAPVDAAVDTIKRLLGHGGKDPSGLVGFLMGAWDTVKGVFTAAKDSLAEAIAAPFREGLNLVSKFAKAILQVVDKIPGMDMGKAIGEIDQFRKAQGFARGGAYARTGGLVSSPMVFMGEEAPRHPEYVIPTNPAYRDRARGLLAQAAGAIGFQEGGRWSVGALEDLWRRAGGADRMAHTMAIVSTAESGAAGRYGYQFARNPSGATGLWQILGQEVPGNLFDAVVNAKNAVWKLAHQGLGAWEASKSMWGPLVNGGGGGIGGLWDKVKGAVGGALDFLLDGGKGLIGMLPDPGDLGVFSGLGREVIRRVTGWIKGKVAGLLGGGGGGGGGGVQGNVQRAIEFAMGMGFAHPSAGQLTGGRHAAGSLHYAGRAVDFGDAGHTTAQMQSLFYGLISKFGDSINELFYDRMPFYIDAHRRVAGQIGGHGDHIHIGFRKGGVWDSYAGGTSWVPQTGPYLLHRGEAVIPRDQNTAGGGVVLNAVIDLGRGITERVRLEFDDQGRQLRGAYAAGTGR